ncbi:MAG: hypothetical protein WCP60_11405 [bacterium]
MQRPGKPSADKWQSWNSVFFIEKFVEKYFFGRSEEIFEVIVGNFEAVEKLGILFHSKRSEFRWALRNGLKSSSARGAWQSPTAGVEMEVNI